MTLEYHIGDPASPKGHALIYFRDGSDPDKVGAATRGGWPPRMLWRRIRSPVDCEQQLEVGRLLGPEPTVNVEAGNARRGRDEVGRPFCGDALDKFRDSRLRRTVVP